MKYPCSFILIGYSRDINSLKLQFLKKKYGEEKYKWVFAYTFYSAIFSCITPPPPPPNKTCLGGRTEKQRSFFERTSIFAVKNIGSCSKGEEEPVAALLIPSLQDVAGAAGCLLSLRRGAGQFSSSRISPQLTGQALLAESNCWPFFSSWVGNKQ